VKRSTTNGGPYAVVANPTGPSYTNSGLANGTTYFYVVSALNAAGESGNGAQVSAMPFTPNPTNPATIFIASQGVNFLLSWTNGIAPFQLQMNTNLAAGPWQNFGGLSNTNSLIVPPTAPAAFYRIMGQ
jgi:cellulose 1,4-beta-cellobiosidase